jgi:hypothetical protein
MTGMKRLRYVWRRKLNDYSLPAFRGIFHIFEPKIRILAKGFFSAKNRGDQDLGKLVDFEEELEERAGGGGWVDER